MTTDGPERGAPWGDDAPGDPRPFHVCFVCSGNICRSPYAEALLRDAVERAGLGRSVRVSSLGTLGIEDSPAHPLTLRVAAERRLGLFSFRSRGLSEERAAAVDLLVALGREHLGTIRERIAPLGEGAPRLWLISAPGLDEIPEEDDGIPDPIGADEATYRLSLRAIEVAIPPLWDAIRVAAEL